MGLFGGLKILAVDKSLAAVANARIPRFAVVLRRASLPDAGIAVLIHGARHVTLTPECQPTLTTTAPSVTAQDCVKAS